MAASPEVVLQAILAIHNGHTSAEDRRQAGQICEDVKADPIAAMNAANMLIRPAQPDPARHFGLSLLGTVIEQRWHQAGFEQEQMQIKQLILEMMAGGTKPLLEEAAFIKEKLCSLVSAVGCREWPQRWETMLPDLMGIAAMGHEQQELMLLALRVLGEDIMEFNDKLDAGRRADLSQALKILLPQILQWVYGFIEEKYQQFTAVVGQGGAGGNDARTLQQLVSAAVKLLQSYTQWIPLHLIYRHNLSQIFSTLLHDPAFKVPACECLLLLCSRKVSRISNKKDKLEAGSTDEDVATSKAQLLAVVGTLGEAPLGGERQHYVSILCDTRGHCVCVWSCGPFGARVVHSIEKCVSAAGPAELLADPDNAYKFAKRVSQVIVAIGDFQIDGETTRSFISAHPLRFAAARLPLRSLSSLETGRPLRSVRSEPRSSALAVPGAPRESCLRLLRGRLFCRVAHRAVAIAGHDGEPPGHHRLDLPAQDAVLAASQPGDAAAAAVPGRPW